MCLIDGSKPAIRPVRIGFWTNIYAEQTFDLMPKMGFLQTFHETNLLIIG
jgi:hypothetical protein